MFLEGTFLVRLNTRGGEQAVSQCRCGGDKVLYCRQCIFSNLSERRNFQALCEVYEVRRGSGSVELPADPVVLVTRRAAACTELSSLPRLSRPPPAFTSLQQPRRRTITRHPRINSKKRRTLRASSHTPYVKPQPHRVSQVHHGTTDYTFRHISGMLTFCRVLISLAWADSRLGRGGIRRTRR